MTEQERIDVVDEAEVEDDWEQCLQWHDEQGRQVVYDAALEARLQQHYTRIQRPPWRPVEGFGPSDILVKAHSPQIMLLKRTKTLIEHDPHSRVVLHATGRAIAKAIDLALQLGRAFQGALVISPTTLTIHCIDDWVPTDLLSPHARLTCTRLVSGIQLVLSLSGSS